MPRSTTIWAAALVLATMSGSGPILTTAEAMPAPGPQPTAERPRYYFPRHVKRQIVTNSTAPPAATDSSTSLVETSDIESRQTSNNRFSSFWNSIFSSNAIDDASSSSIIEVEPTRAPIRPQPPIPGVGSTGGLPETIVPPSPVPEIPEIPSEIPEVPEVGTTAGLPSSVVQPTSEVPPPETSAVESSVNEPSEPGSTGGVPSSIVTPTEAPTSAPEPAPSSEPAEVGSTGGVPAPVVSPSTSAEPVEEPTPTPTAGTSIEGPFIIPGPGSTGGLPETVVQPSPSSSAGLGLPSLDLPIIGSTGGLIPSEIPLPLPSQGSTGGLPPVVVLPTGGSETHSDASGSPSSSTGILVGITTALGTSENETPTPTPTLAIPTSESKSESEALPLLPSLISDISSILDPSGILNPAPGPTAPTTTAGVIPILPSQISSVLSVITSDVESLVSSVADELPTPIPDLPSIISSIASSVATDLPPLVSSSLVTEPTGSGVLPSDPLGPILTGIESSLSTAIPTLLPSLTDLLPTGVIPTDLVPTGVSTGVPTLPTDVPTDLPTDLPTSLPTGPTGLPTLPTNPTDSGVFPPTPTGSGITPPPTGGSTVQTDLPTSEPTGIPTSETKFSETIPSPTDVPTLVPTPPTNSTGELPSPTAPATTGVEEPTSPTSSFETPSETPSTSAVEITFNPPTSLPPKPTTPPPASIVPTATDSETTLDIGTTKIIAEPTGSPTGPVESSIPSELPKMIAPPTGMADFDPNKFTGQIGFKWPLNYPFVYRNDGGNQIFEFLPVAIADALSINQSEVVMQGLKPFDTLEYSGFITTLALFQIPSDLVNNLKSQMRNPNDKLWNNEKPIVNQLTDLINPAIPLEGGPLAGDGSQTAPGSPGSSSTGGSENGGAMGGDMGASRKINPTSAGIATGAVMGAIAYGAAMFFVARRYRNKKMRHQRASSVPSTSRYTYGSMQQTGGVGAFMSGGRGPPGRTTPGGRDSRGSGNSDSSNGRSVRTQQISAPVMAENSLGWN